MNVTALLFFFLSRPQYLLGSYHVNVFPHKVLYNTYSAWALQAYYPTIQAQVLSKPHIKSELEENSAAASTKLVYTSLFISWNSVLWLKLRRQLRTHLWFSAKFRKRLTNTMKKSSRVLLLRLVQGIWWEERYDSIFARTKILYCLPFL